MASLAIPITKLRDDAVVPSYAYPGDAGVDLRAVESVSLAPFERALVPRVSRLRFPKGMRASFSHVAVSPLNRALPCSTLRALSICHYRGELKVALINLDAHSTFEVGTGRSIAQLVIQKVENVEWSVVDALDETERGCGGFGSSGVQ